MARVLLPVVEREHGRRACDLATTLFPEGTLVLLHVLNPSEVGYSQESAVPSVAQGWYDEQKEASEELFADLESHVDDASSVECHREIGQPARTIVEQTAERRIDHVVMGSHGRRGISRLLLGTVAETVVRRSPVPVTVVQ